MTITEEEYEAKLRSLSEFLWKVDRSLCELSRDIDWVQRGIQAALPPEPDEDYVPGITKLAS